MIKNGRQTAPTLDGIRDDHKERYWLAIEYAEIQLGYRGINTVIDVGTGTGYGAYMMATEGFDITAYEIDQSAIDYGEQHYSHPRLKRIQGDVAQLDLPEAGMVTAFEIIEHTHAAAAFLSQAARKALYLVASVPNEDVVPFESSKHRQHVRHYTPQEFRDFLESCGWEIKRFGCQVGKHGEAAEPRDDTTDGRTLIAVAKSKRKHDPGYLKELIGDLA